MLSFGLEKKIVLALKIRKPGLGLFVFKTAFIFEDDILEMKPEGIHLI